MKRNIYMLTCFLSFLLFPHNCFAETNELPVLEELGEERTDYIEILDLEEQILFWLDNFLAETKGENLPEDFKVDFESAKKIYVDSAIFSLETSEVESVKEELEQNIYMWLLLQTIGNDTYPVHIAKGLPLNEEVIDQLTEEEIQEIKANEGKWIVTAVELLEGEQLDYEEIIAKELEAVSYDIENAGIVICGGLEHIQQSVALVMNDDKVDLLIPLYQLTIEGTEEEIETIKPDMADIEDEVYLFDEIKDAVNQMETPDEETSGGGAYIKLSNTSTKTNKSVIPAAVIGFLLLSFVIVHGYNKKKHL